MCTDRDSKEFSLDFGCMMFSLVFDLFQVTLQ